MSFQYSFDEGRRFRREVSRWQRQLGNLKWMWPQVTEKIEQHHVRVFNQEGAHGKLRKWVPLAQKTALARFYRAPIIGSYTDAYRAHSTESPEHRILHWTHALRLSMVRRTAIGAVRKFHAGSMEYGTDLPHAYDHQHGTMTSFGKARDMPGGWTMVAGGKQQKVPPRPFLDHRGVIPVVGRTMHSAITRMLNGSKLGSLRGR